MMAKLTRSESEARKLRRLVAKRRKIENSLIAAQARLNTCEETRQVNDLTWRYREAVKKENAVRYAARTRWMAMRHKKGLSIP